MKKILKHIIVCIFVLLVSFFLVDYFVCKSKLNKIETIQNNMPIAYPFHLCQVTGYHSEGQYLVVETVREGTNINFVISSDSDISKCQARFDNKETGFFIDIISCYRNSDIQNSNYPLSIVEGVYE